MNPLLDITAHPVIAHRGASGSAPENTLAAFELALRHGADAFELDVRLTGDGVPVLLHDPTLDRTTHHSGPLSATSLAQLSEIDAGARFSPDGQTYPFRGRGVRVPTLRQVLQKFPQVPILLDLKEVAVESAVRQVLLEENAAERCVLASEHMAALRLFREPPFASAAAGREIATLLRAALLRLRPGAVSYKLLSVPMRYRGFRIPSRAFVGAARRLGCPVHVWTVNDAALAQQLWSVGVAGIVTNFPALIRGAR
jgi:glycerophosphoryl diester phosphodiesterase